MGKLTTREATVTDWIDGQGGQHSAAIAGRSRYIVVDRDAHGAIWQADSAAARAALARAEGS